jgi:bacterioferritin (cytochrome b1)
MNPPNAIEILNRVLAIVEKSFPQYSRWARPYIPAGRQRAMQTLQDIAVAEDSLARQVTDQIIAMGGLPDSGDFPMEYTDTHDLGIDYMVQEAIGYMRQDIVELELCVQKLAPEPAAHAVVEEILNIERRHLKSLEELHVQPGSSTKFGANGAAANDAPASATTNPAT